MLMITCEHGGNHVPPEYARLFRGCRNALDSHLGWDPGALKLARDLSRTLKAPLFFSETTRLLVDLNRSTGNPRLFSEFTRSLPRETRSALLAEHYLPFRLSARQWAGRLISGGGSLLHLSIHSFTPVLDGVERNADLGLLYDPRRAGEKAFCAALKEKLIPRLPGLRVRFNYPYRGVADGHTTSLRRHFPKRYIGIEIEVNQRLPLGPEKDWNELKQTLGEILREMSWIRQ